MRISEIIFTCGSYWFERKSCRYLSDISKCLYICTFICTLIVNKKPSRHTCLLGPHEACSSAIQLTIIVNMTELWPSALARMLHQAVESKQIILWNSFLGIEHQLDLIMWQEVLAEDISNVLPSNISCLIEKAKY